MMQGQAISKLGLLIWFLSLGKSYDGAGRKSDIEITASLRVWVVSSATYYVHAGNEVREASPGGITGSRRLAAQKINDKRLHCNLGIAGVLPIFSLSDL
jgi:hypothetical protein